MDIRSFFAPKKGKKAGDKPPASSKNTLLNKVTKTAKPSKEKKESSKAQAKKKRTIDSDEEDFEREKKAKKSRNSPDKAKAKTTPSKAAPKSPKIAKSPKSVSPKSVKSKPKSKPTRSPKQTKHTVIDVDDDDEDEEGALAILMGDAPEVSETIAEVDDTANDEAIALALLQGDDPQDNEPRAIKKAKLGKDEKTTSSIDNALEDARRKSPKKSNKGTRVGDSLQKFAMSPPKKKSKSSGWSASDMQAVEAVTKVETQKKTTNKRKIDKDGAGPETKKVNPKRAYAQMMNRKGPQNLGAKELPKGKPNCLHGLKFICTGVMETITREQSEDLIKRYGGTLMKSVSKSLDYVVIGRDAGPSKLEKIEKFGLKTLDEDAFFQLIESKEQGPDDQEIMAKEEAKSSKKKTPKKSTSIRVKHEPIRSNSAPVNESAKNGTPGLRADGNSMLWSVKYAPTSSARVIGQQGAKSNMNKLKSWLNSWYDNRRRSDPIPRKASETGWEFKACLMAGPPGVGKTTTAHLVCQELGFSVIDMNASDCRNKSSLEQEVAMLLGNTTMTQFFGKKTARKQALIMDEVDGMDGNADRGSMPALIKLIKTTKIPIICMANDKDSVKMRTLKNHVFVNNFRKLQHKNILGFLMSILHKEGVKCDKATLEQIIEGANCDIRQILNNLEMWSQTSKVLTYDGVRKNVRETVKHIKENPFQFVQKFFQPNFHKQHINARVDTFFNDYSLAPLFVQEMYLKTPLGNSVQELARMSSASDSIRDGDMIHSQIFSQQDFKLLPMYAVASCIRPGYLLARGLNARMDFPQSLGKMSSEGKFRRILAELRHHMRTETFADSGDMRMNYIPYLRKRLVNPLVAGHDGCHEEVGGILDTYHLSRDDWDSVNELCQLKNAPDPTKGISTKVKTGFTRFYNKGTHVMPYTEDVKAKKKRKSAGAATLGGEESVEGLFDDDEKDDDDDVTTFQKKQNKGKGKAKAKSSSKKKTASKKKK